MRRLHAPDPRFPIIVWSLLASVLVLSSFSRGYHVGRCLTPAATPLLPEPVRRLARVLKSGGLAMIVLAAIGVAVGLVVGKNVEQAAWYAGAPGALIPLALVHAWRGRRILALLGRGGATATTDGKGHVFIVRDGHLRSWLMVTPAALASADLHPVPPARVHRE